MSGVAHSSFWETPQGTVLRRRYHTRPRHGVIYSFTERKSTAGDPHEDLVWTYTLLAKYLSSHDCAGLVMDSLVFCLWKSKSAQKLSWEGPTFLSVRVGDGGTCKTTFRRGDFTANYIKPKYCQSCHRHKRFCCC